jgi:hypothetical protein
MHHLSNFYPSTGIKKAKFNKKRKPKKQILLLIIISYNQQASHWHAFCLSIPTSGNTKQKTVEVYSIIQSMTHQTKEKNHEEEIVLPARSTCIDGIFEPAHGLFCTTEYSGSLSATGYLGLSPYGPGDAGGSRKPLRPKGQEALQKRTELPVADDNFPDKHGYPRSKAMI